MWIMQIEYTGTYSKFKSDNAICIFTIYNMNVDCKTGLNFEKKNWATASSNSFQQTLLYNGTHSAD